MLASYLFRQISAKLLAETKSSTTISEQDFNQNVGEVACSVYLAVY